MDKGIRYISAIRGDKHWPYRPYLEGLWPCGFFFMVALTSLGACGGGGSGSASSSQGVAVTEPPAIRQVARVPLLFGESYQSEYARQSGLDDIGAAAAYDKGYAGFSVKTGVVDTGVDSTHSQLSSVRDGYDFHGNSGGLSDPDGHGTHVASLMAAKRDGVSMHGVAPHADVRAYRIFDHNGSFGGKSGGQIVPTLVTRAIDHDIMVLNNSWASNYEVTDFSRSATKSVLGNELGAWQKAVKAGMVMVWAAGNEGDDQVSVRAGLPYHYGDVKKGWLAVVSFDPNGKEPRYTNRCGVARDWCLAAPGGGDAVSYLGVYGARSGGGYELRSGTSMAAPHVSGALALVLDAFPQLTPQKAAVRLLETATYEGLETADGCTIASCTPADMADVFGQGRVSLQDALAPIGTLSLVASAAPASATQAVMDSGFIIDESLFSAMTGVRFIAQDDFDKAAFTVPATAFLSAPDTGFSKQATPASVAQQAVSRDDDTSFYMTSQGAFPDRVTTHGRLHDISLRAMQSWTGLNRPLDDGQWQAHFGYAATRQAVMMRRDYYNRNGDSWVGFGIDQAKGRFLDSEGYGALAWGKGQSHWLTLGHYYPLLSGGVRAEYQAGQSRVSGSDNCIICYADAHFERWALAYEAPLASHLLSDNAQMEIRLYQPLSVTEAHFKLHGATKEAIDVELARQPREVGLHFTQTALGGQIRIGHQVKPRGQDHALSASWKMSF